MKTSEFTRLIGERVRKRRHAAGLSQEALAAIAGLHRTQVNLIEQNRRKIRIETLLRLAVALNVDPSDLLPRLSEAGANVQQSQKPRGRSKIRRAIPGGTRVSSSRDAARDR